MAQKKGTKKSTKKKASSKKTKKDDVKVSVASKKSTTKKTAKKETTRKKPTKRRRTSKAKASKTRRKETPKKKTTRKRKNEFEIPIHAIDVSPQEKEKAREEAEKEHNAAIQNSDVYPIEKSKRVEGLKKKKEIVIPKENEDDLNLNRVKGRKQKRKKTNNGKIAIIIAGVLLGIIALASAGYAIWKTQSPSAADRQDMLTITTEETVAIGASQNISLTISNSSNVAMTDIDVDAIFPASFEVGETTPVATNDTQNAWSIDTLEPGQKFSILISGRIIEKPGSEAVIQTRLSYKPENGSASFTEEDEVVLTLDAPRIGIETNAPESIAAGSGFDFVVKAENKQGDDLENLELRLVSPKEYAIAETKPKVSQDGEVSSLKIEELKNAESEAVTFSGSLDGKRDEEKDFIVQVGFVDKNGRFYTQVEKEVRITIAEVVAQVTTRIYGDEQNAMSFGEKLEYTVSYKNEGTEALKDVEIETILDETYVDTGTIEVDGADVIGGKISWTKNNKEELETVEPGAEGEFAFSVELRQTITINSEQDGNFSHIAQSIISAQVGEVSDRIEIKGNQAVTKINSAYTVNVEAHYYDFEGIQVGVGPNPPQVGEETVYRIYMVASNEANELSNGVLTMTLADNVKFTSKSSTNVGNISTSGKNATWRIGNIPTYTGRFKDNIEAFVEVSYVPTEEDAGVTPNLTSLIEFSAIDTFTEQELEKEIENTTTSLDGDAYNSVSGEVVSENGASTDQEGQDGVQVNINP